MNTPINELNSRLGVSDGHRKHERVLLADLVDLRVDVPRVYLPPIVKFHLCINILEYMLLPKVRKEINQHTDVLPSPLVIYVRHLIIIASLD